jgi:metal-responsive CopG/Arc/MetJ family transcriptional regulator
VKTSVSIPDEVFEEAERLATRTRRSRSRLFSDAIREHLARHAPEEITASMDRVCTQLENPRRTMKDEFVATAAWRTLKECEW